MNRALAIAAVALWLWSVPLRAQDGTPTKGEPAGTAVSTHKDDSVVHGLIRGLVKTVVTQAVKKAVQPKPQAPASQAGTAPTPEAAVAAAPAVTPTVPQKPTLTPAAIAVPTNQPPASIGAPEPPRAVAPPRPHHASAPKPARASNSKKAPPIPMPVPSVPAVAAPPSAADILRPSEARASPPVVGTPPEEAPRQAIWLLLGGLLAAALGTGLALGRIQRLFRTRKLLSVEHRFNPDERQHSIAALRFAAPPVSLSVRLEAGTVHG